MRTNIAGWRFGAILLAVALALVVVACSGDPAFTPTAAAPSPEAAVAGATLTVASSPEAAITGATPTVASTPMYTPNQRFGFGVSERLANITSYDVSQLGAGWYSNWDFSANPPKPAGLEYVQLVPVSPGLVRLDQAALEAAVRAQPGSTWIIGNEPERRSLDGQSKAYDYAGLSPQEYAVVYHSLYATIKGLDPTAKIAIGGVVQPSSVRLEWLDQVWSSYQELTGERMPVDIWNIHLQLMREKRNYAGCDDCWGADIPEGINDVQEGLLLEIEDNVNSDLMQSLVWDFRRWMAEKGERDKPLIVSEYGVLMPSEYLGKTVEEGDARVREYMLSSFDFFLSARDPEIGCPSDQNRLVQRWLWYSLNEVPYHYDEMAAAWIGFNGSLFDWQANEWPGVMTPLGQAYAEYTKALVSDQQASGGS